MRGKVARRLRKEAFYRDGKLVEPSTSWVDNHDGKGAVRFQLEEAVKLVDIFGKFKAFFQPNNNRRGTIFLMGYRRYYKHLKREHVYG